MDVQTGFFYVFSLVMLFAAFRVITARNPVHAVLFLMLAFSQAAGIWLLLKAEFLAVTLVLVYLGAVMVLFLFVVMMLDIHIDSLRQGFWRHFPLALAIGALISLAISLWNRVFKMGRTGQSVGKKVIGLKLIDDKTGQPIGAGMCFLRELVSSIVNQVIYLSYLWMLWDADKQTLADKAVHSTVVVLPKA